MSEKPILFSGEVVRAILDGRKTQTRRLVKVPRAKHMVYDLSKAWRDPGFGDGEYLHVPYWHETDGPQYNTSTRIYCPYGQPGDTLWVRETHQLVISDDAYVDGDDNCPDWHKIDHKTGAGLDVRYMATEPAALLYSEDAEPSAAARPSIHMPRWACRLELEVTDVRVERVTDISAHDAQAEGISFSGNYWLGGIHAIKKTPQCWPTPQRAFQALWESINAKRGHGWDVNDWVWALTFKRKD